MRIPHGRPLPPENEQGRGLSAALSYPDSTELSLMPRLVDAVRDLNIAFSRNALRHGSPEGWKPGYSNDHQRIYECLESGDYNMAASLLETHIWHGERVSAR